MARAPRGPWPSLALLPWPGRGAQHRIAVNRRSCPLPMRVGRPRPQSLLSPSHSPLGPPFPKGWSARRVWLQPSWAARDGPAGGGKAEEDLGRRTWTVARAQGSWRWAADGTVCQSWTSKCSASWEVGATLGPTGTAKETGRGSWGCQVLRGQEVYAESCTLQVAALTAACRPKACGSCCWRSRPCGGDWRRHWPGAPLSIWCSAGPIRCHSCTRLWAGLGSVHSAQPPPLGPVRAL